VPNGRQDTIGARWDAPSEFYARSKYGLLCSLYHNVARALKQALFDQIQSRETGFTRF